jgi:hypothetical protein
MIMPEHCREVGLKDVDFHLTQENIEKSAVGKKVYFRTRFLVLRNGKECCVLRIDPEGDGVMNDVVNVETLSLPEDSIWIDEPAIDVLSPSSIVGVALDHPGKTVVVRGSHEHVSFVKDPKAYEIRVVDVVPPHPPKLLSLVRTVLESQAIDVPVRVVEEITDLGVLARDVETDEIILPCKGEILTEKKVHYLAQSPEVGDATLIGCEYSKKVAKEIYDNEIPFIQMCPKRIARDSDTPGITKCCELQSGFEVEGNLAVVPWGARVDDIVQALKHLLEGMSEIPSDPARGGKKR